ncbi:MAG: DUF3857 domain-containing protein [Sphingobacteriales bacterium]|nr:DUF3857 domain-containing protein [Sphingobacteriales bacterium]
MKIRVLFIIFICIGIVSITQGQDKPKVRFGKVEAADFDLSAYKFDPEAGALIISDAGKTEFVVNKEQRFALQFKRQTRIKIINQKGFDAATIEIPLYTDGHDEEKIEGFKAVTYNLENGNVTETKVSSKDVFTERVNKNWILRKFTFPSLKEGSIIEYSYTINSNYIINLQEWEFQGEYPRLWSEYEVNIPEYFQYSNIAQGYLAFTVNKAEQTQQIFTFEEATSFVPGNMARSATSNPYQKIINSGEKFTMTAKVFINKWAIKDVPGLRPEKFTSSYKNYISKINFQLSSVKFPDRQPQIFYSSWEDLNRQLLENDDFGVPLNKSNNWMDDDIKAIVGGSTNDLDKAKKIVAYLKNNFTCTGNGIYLTDNFKNIFSNKKGNVADINLLLLSILRHEKIKAEPVILSTRSNGYVNELYPIIDRFNYVICEAQIEGKKYYMDATQAKMGFGYLPLKCYNGYSRIISSEEPRPVYLLTDSVQETKRTTVFIVNDDNNNWVGSFSSELGYYGSADVRDELAEKGKEEYYKKIKTTLPAEIEIRNPAAEPVNDFEKPLTVSFEFDLKFNKDNDLIYFNPLLSEGMKDNPFKSAERKYPVEMPFAQNIQYIANIDIPSGYEVEELPKREKIIFNDGEGLYEYIIQKNGNTIMMQCRFRLSLATYLPDDYAGLRDFYGNVVKKQSEVIVFRKKK